MKALQADLGVTQDGKFGPETAKAFDEAVARARSPRSTASVASAISRTTSTMSRFAL